MIKTYVGPMFAGKSSSIINTYNKIWNKNNVLVFKPKIDTRDTALIKSRDYQEGIKATCIENIKDIKKYIKPNTKTIFIDEAQFLKGNHKYLNELSILKHIDIYILVD